MKRTLHVQKWIRSGLVGVALAASTALSLAANIVYTFDTDTQGWGGGNGNTAVDWDNTQSRGGGGGGCLKCTLTPITETSTNNTMAASVNVDFDTTTYFGVEFDMYIDAASGTDGNGNYGNMQIADTDAGWGWHSQWYGGVGGPAGKFSAWRHVIIPFAAAYGPKAHLQILVQSSSGDYSTNIVVYIDNVVFQDGTAPNHVYLYDFAWPEECIADSTGGVGGVFSQDTTLTNGCLKEVVNYGVGNTGWQDAAGEFHTFNAAFDPSKFTYLDFDLYLDAPAGQPSYGEMQLHYWWSWTGIGTAALSTNNIGKWTHYSFALPSPGANNPQGIVFHPGGNNLSNVFTYYIDNVTVWKPAAPPTITELKKEDSATGAKITMDQDSSQYQRDAICVPSGWSFFTWYGYTPITYSFTITNFPEAVAHHGFEAHLYIVNQDTVPNGNGTWNQTYGGCDWNAADIFQFRIENSADGGVIARIDWKTNLPGANPLTNAIYHPIEVAGPTAVGTWSLTFTDNENGYITGPGITQTNFTLPADAAARFDPNTVCLNSFVQFGMFKNDGDNDGHNNGASGTFSEISMSGGLYPFTETFPGPGLTGSGTAWRASSSSAVQWVPPDTTWWLTWTTPDDGYSMKASGDVTVPMSSWGDAGVTYTYTQGSTKVGAVPEASVPSGNAAFFRLAK